MSMPSLCAMLMFGVMCYVFREGPLAVAEAVGRKTNVFIRYMAFFGVIVGLAILYVALPQV